MYHLGKLQSRSDEQKVADTDVISIIDYGDLLKASHGHKQQQTEAEAGEWVKLVAGMDAAALAASPNGRA